VTRGHRDETWKAALGDGGHERLLSSPAPPVMARTPVSRWAFVDPCEENCSVTRSDPTNVSRAWGGESTQNTPAELSWAETYRNCDGSDRLPAIPGHEVSGVVESVAHGVTDASIGGEVYALTSFCRDVGGYDKQSRDRDREGKEAA
jgi:hypothetical protein